VRVNCYRIHQKSLNFIYPFKFYSNFTNKNVSWLHFSWPTQYLAAMSLSHCKLGTESGNIEIFSSDAPLPLQIRTESGNIWIFSSDVPLPLQIGTESRNIGIFNSDVPLPLQIGDREREYRDV